MIKKIISKNVDFKDFLPSTLFTLEGQLERYKRDDLRELCKSNSLSQIGTKKELISRLLETEIDTQASISLKTSPNKKRNREEEITKEDFLCWLITLVCMEISPYPEMKFYWLEGNPFFPKHLIIPQIITKEKFNEITRSLNFDLKDGENKNFIESTLEMLNQNRKKALIPETSLAIDDVLKKLRTKINPVGVSIHIKPAKRGLKFINITSKSGFTYETKMYLGKKMTMLDVCIDFLKNLPKKHEEKELKYTITCDSGFGSKELVNFCQNNGFGFCIMMKPSKDFGQNCKLMENFALEKGDWITCSINGKILVTRFQDKKSIYIFSNYSKTQPIIQNEEQSSQRYIPPCVEDYNFSMHYVDDVDKVTNENPHKNQFISTSFFKYLNKFALADSFALYKLKFGNIPYRTFLQKLVIEFLEEKTNKKKKISLFSTPNFHILLKGNRQTKGRCCVCNSFNYTTSTCSTCNLFLHTKCHQKHLERYLTIKIKEKN